MREGCIGKQNSRIEKWRTGRGDQRADNREQEAAGADSQIEKSDVRALDEEVEGEKKEAQDEEESAQGEAALREAADRVEKAGGNYAETRFGAGQIKRADRFIAGQIAAEGGEFIFHPERELFAIAPQIERAEKKNTIAEASQQTESRTRTPMKHGTSPPAGRPEYSKPLREW
jgi:hypothetical protein